jgi:cytochrome P450
MSGAALPLNVAERRALLKSRDFDVVEPHGYFDRLAETSSHSLSNVRRAVRNVLFFARGDRHAALRRPAVEFFRASNMTLWQPVVERCVDDALAALPEAGTADLMADFARPLTSRFLSQLIGFDDSDHARFDQWTEEARWLLEPLLPMRRMKAIDVALGHLFDAAQQARQQVPAPDLPTLPFLHAPLGSLNDEDRAWVAVSMYAAGQVTMDTLANVLVELASRPSDWRQELINPASRKPFVETLIGSFGSISRVARIAQRETALHGHSWNEGERVVLPLMSRTDQSADGTASASDHLAFGYGFHMCVGAAIARQIIASALIGLAERYSEVTLVAQPSGYGQSAFFRTPLDVPCSLSSKDLCLND